MLDSAIESRPAAHEFTQALDDFAERVAAYQIEDAILWQCALPVPAHLPLPVSTERYIEIRDALIAIYGV